MIRGPIRNRQEPRRTLRQDDPLQGWSTTKPEMYLIIKSINITRVQKKRNHYSYYTHHRL